MISIIAALTGERVIGKDNKLPWHISDDLRNFKRLTKGNTVIMGRKTYESIGKPLPHRNNVVVSSSLASNGIIVCRSLEDALETGRSFGKEIFIIGGANIYAQSLEFADRMYLSYVKKNYEGDTFFPEFNESDWEVVDRQDFPEFELVTYQRK